MTLPTIVLVSTGWFVAVLLLSLRIGAMLLATPIFSSANIPVVVRVLVVLSLSAALVAGLTATPGMPGGTLDKTIQQFAELVRQPGFLVQAACTELALGLTLSVAIHLAFAAFAVAGRLLDIQIGFGLAQVFDPAFNASSPVLSTAFSQIAVIAFFLIDGHHAVLRIVAYSLERFPLGHVWPLNAAWMPLLKQMAGLLALALALSAPIVFCLLLAELALGVLARSLPQMNMLTMGVPVKIVIGLVALSVWFGGVGAVMARVYRGIYTTWDAMFAADIAQPIAGKMR